MPDLHLRNWPPGVPQRIDCPQQPVVQNLLDTAARKPDAPAIHYYGRTITYGDLARDVAAMAGWLAAQGVRRGDRVLICMQNGPQWVIAYFAIQRANAVVVPVNPMYRRAELEHLARDTGARIALVGAELLEHIRPLLADGDLDHLVPAALADMADPDSDLPLPETLAGQTDTGLGGPGVTPWRQALAARHPAPPLTVGPDDMAVIMYSSGTTGQPKGCVHLHRGAMATIETYVNFTPYHESDVVISVLPFFHVTGMQNAMNVPIRVGAPIVMMSRWDRDVAAQLIERYRVTVFRSISTMVIDLMNAPDFDRYDLSSIRSIGCGGAAVPEAVAARLQEMSGLQIVEGYGLSETISVTHLNPAHAPRRQCLGIPLYDVDSRVLDLEDGRELGPGETGEIVMRAPQVFQGYWRNPEATAEAFVEVDGKPFFRTGDIGHYDADGYWYMTDRVKRMINASGFKVWPAEVEALMHRHPDIAEACVVGTRDPRRGESVKVFIVRRTGSGDSLTADAVIAWCRAEMAAYKVPRAVEFVQALPKSGTGKVQWRELMDRENTVGRASA